MLGYKLKWFIISNFYVQLSNVPGGFLINLQLDTVGGMSNLKKFDRLKKLNYIFKSFLFAL